MPAKTILDKPNGNTKPPGHPATMDRRARTKRENSRETKQTFLSLAEQWREETGDNSCFDEVIAHPSYQRIIALGEDVIPFLLEDMEQNPSDWLHALRRISGQSPAAGLRGVDVIAAAWRRWGKEKGYI